MSTSLGIGLYIATAVAMIPQIYAVIKEKNSNQISLLFVSFILITSILWTIWMFQTNTYMGIACLFYTIMILIFIVIIIYYR